MTIHDNRVLMVAGEASADAHAAALLGELRKLNPKVEAFGLGGSRLREAGCELFLDFSQAAVVGITEVLPQTGTYISAYRSLIKEIKQRPPRAAVLLDMPDFNIFLAGRIKRISPPTRIIYYISPQVWAWRPGRVRKIAARADTMLVLFDFEEKLYKKAGMDAEFVGHPLRDTIAASASADELREEFELGSEERVIALLPGSRTAEVNRYLPAMAEAVAELDDSSVNVAFLLARAPGLPDDMIKRMLGQAAGRVRIESGRTYDVLEASDMAVVASGTATLETAIMEKPMVVLAAVSRLSYEIGIRMVNIPRYSLPNVIAGRELVPELVQNEVNGRELARRIRDMLEHPERLETIKKELRLVKQSLGPGGASARTARAVYRRLWQR
ncbi:MAG: lipid-A-disaccharide synthase [bacterium]